MIFLNIEKCPFTYWFNGRWFLQIVDRDRLPMAERVGCGTPCLLGSLGVWEVVGSHPGRGSSEESFSSYQKTNKIFSPEMPCYAKF